MAESKDTNKQEERPVHTLGDWVGCHTNGVDCKESNDCTILLAQVLTNEMKSLAENLYREVQSLRKEIEELKDASV